MGKATERGGKSNGKNRAKIQQRAYPMKNASRDGGGEKEQGQGEYTHVCTEYIEQALQVQQGGVTWAKSCSLTLSSPVWRSFI